MRSVVFGADGLTFRILHPMMESGDLPNFKRLALEGCEGILESRYPPLTPPAWTSLSTGMKPASHGVYDFWSYNNDGQEQGMARSARLQTSRKGGKAIWNVLSEFGKQVLVINVPVTYPPEPVNGIMISGYMTPSTEVEFTYPAAFKEELFKAVPDYQIDLELRKILDGSADEVDRLIDATLQMTERRIELMTYLLKEKQWDFCYVVFVGPDRLQHSLWDEITSLNHRAIEYYRQLDRALGVVLDQLGPDDNLFVVSDHGFHGVNRTFEINEYLYSKGLITPGKDTIAQRRRSTRLATVKHMLRRLGLLNLARRARRTVELVGVTHRSFDDVYEPQNADIDWKQTLAYVPSMASMPAGFANIFLSPELSNERVSELIEDLKKQRDPKTGKLLVDAIYTTEVFGTGPYAPQEPHLLVLPNEGITFRLTMGNKHLWDDASTKYSPDKKFGVHHRDGVLYACGGGIKRGFKVPQAEVFDLVPTVLRSMGLPLPYKFDGRVLDELFVEGKANGQKQPEAEKSAEGGLARSRLRKLLEV